MSERNGLKTKICRVLFSIHSKMKFCGEGFTWLHSKIKFVGKIAYTGSSLNRSQCLSQTQNFGILPEVVLCAGASIIVTKKRKYLLQNVIKHLFICLRLPKCTVGQILVIWQMFYDTSTPRCHTHHCWQWVHQWEGIHKDNTHTHASYIFDITATHDDALFTALKMTSPYALWQ